MPITRNSDQKSRTLEQFYEDLKKESNPYWVEVGDAMLDFLAMVNETFQTTQLWGLTSHEYLVIQAEDNWESPAYVVVRAVGKQYEIRYLMPTHHAPWPNAIVNGSVNSLEEAKKYLLIAMKESEGWEDSQELQELYSEAKKNRE